MCNMETRKKAKYCGKTIRTVYQYISTTAVHSYNGNHNITEDYMKEIFGYLEYMLTKNEDSEEL